MRNLTSFYNLLILYFIHYSTQKPGKPVLQVATVRQKRKYPNNKALDQFDTRVTTGKSVVQVGQYK